MLTLRPSKTVLLQSIQILSRPPDFNCITDQCKQIKAPRTFYSLAPLGTRHRGQFETQEEKAVVIPGSQIQLEKTHLAGLRS